MKMFNVIARAALFRPTLAPHCVCCSAGEQSPCYGEIVSWLKARLAMTCLLLGDEAGNDE